MNFVVLYCIRNQYEMIEEYIFKHSPCDYSKVDILIYDDDSSEEQIQKLKDLVSKYKNIEWINENQESKPNPVLSSFQIADDYLSKVNKNVDWILFFENDVFAFQNNFWDVLNENLKENKFLEQVGFIGFSSYQNYTQGIKRTNGSPTIGRGCILDEILNTPHSGWYKDLPNEWYNVDYFVVEVPNWQSVCVNRKLFRENIEIDFDHEHRLLSVDSASHQFMIKGFYNIVLPKLSVYHDSGELKKDIKLSIDSNYSRSNSSHEVFKKTWGWSWGYRNQNLRQEFNMNFNLYTDSIQSKMFNMKVSDGPKRIEDFE
tara:strand:+ start:23376 stop:24320 length:945 start_codon:yes stop_codon:yes gene_type:complete